MINRLISAAIALVSVFSVAAQDKIEKGDINLIVVSDLGRNGYYEQKGVASTDRKSTRLNSSHWS